MITTKDKESNDKFLRVVTKELLKILPMIKNIIYESTIIDIQKNIKDTRDLKKRKKFIIQMIFEIQKKL